MDQLNIGTPGCGALEAWANEYSSFPRGTSHKTRIDAVFEDARTASLFGVPYSRWQINDLKHASRLVASCLQSMREDTSRQQSKQDLYAVLEQLNHETNARKYTARTGTGKPRRK